MSSKPDRQIAKAIALFTMFCLAQLSVFAGTRSPANLTEAAAAPPQATATFKTTNNQPIIINGNSVKPGTTVLSGATIETSAGIGATLQMGSSTLEIAPDTELMVGFTADGNVRVILKRGCVILRTPGNANGVIVTPDGTEIKTGDKHEADVCFSRNATSPIVNQGAAANAGAGANAGIGPAVSAPTINRALLAALIVGGTFAGIAGVLLGGRGTNPSQSTP